ncbi:MAG: hypothetical protein F4112_15940 [Holophagales bacterium]|nr:hypothetical protein [Holophagales bacterium]MYB20869.1 hypothetical protein [Holophagales bacterium]MYD21129.1 hypothetical protein [Holophagales bacterium]MYH25510.1 hypothetical protein [Holophagales bacterium]MYI34440.1 hypothetical protein [Holophagales bacterium]
MSHAAPGVVHVDGRSNADVEIQLTMSDATAARLLHTVRARLPEAAPTPTIESAVLMVLTWAAQGKPPE